MTEKTEAQKKQASRRTEKANILLKKDLDKALEKIRKKYNLTSISALWVDIEHNDKDGVYALCDVVTVNTTASFYLQALSAVISLCIKNDHERYCVEAVKAVNKYIADTLYDNANVIDAKDLFTKKEQ